MKQFLNEEQDPKAVEKIYAKVKGLLTSGEDVEYIAVQKKPAVNLSPDCVALTSKRVIFCRPKNLGLSMEFQDYAWKDVADCHMKESIWGAEFTLKTVKGQTNKIDYLPKAQARKLYQFAQEKEEAQHEYRRNRELEEKRAAAGGVVVTANIPSNSPTIESQPKDPMEALQKLKRLLENDLITQQEFDAKKSEIIARL
ncbi:PH domain-containing protein [Rufibacter quisquiliarum]|uniref:Short C-terminal domain-containing protein n=1 Tax=Rufibacter quisquiliarum TaxID=1549639 RepID=A0A839GSQ4_9BACT|nr:PH domain-containing protein [Rufibacter quisquiliarum]MBA9079899.1 hypothetical protein [Rufibacter quisquiliarum]